MSRNGLALPRDKIPVSDFYGFTPWHVPRTASSELLGFAMKFWHWQGPCRAPGDPRTTPLDPNYCGPGTYSSHLVVSHDGKKNAFFRILSSS